MHKKIGTMLFALLFVAATVFVFQNKQSFAARPVAASDALSSLPASDVIVYADTGRAISETLPAVLASQPAALARINSQLDKFQTESGIDPRSFQSIAAGLRFVSGTDFRAVVIARGNFNSDTLINAGLNAAKAKCAGFKPDEQQYRDHKLYVFNSKANVCGGSVGPRSGADSFAVTALDAGTLAGGDLESVRAALDVAAGSGARVESELLELATTSASALVGFSGKVPAAFIKQLGSQTDPLTKNLAGVRLFYGHVSTTTSDAETFIALRTENADQAHNIAEAAKAFKTLSGFGDSNVAIPSTGVVVGVPTILKNLNITDQGNEVQFSLKLAFTEIAHFAHPAKMRGAAGKLNQ